MSYEFPTSPILGVGAVIVRSGKAVLIKRRNDPYKGQWSVPGGRVEVGEPLADAVRREMREETGLDVVVGPILEVFERIEHSRHGVRYHFVIVDYVCTCAGDALSAGDDAEDAAWVSGDELAGYDIAATAVAVIRKGLQLAQREGW